MYVVNDALNTFLLTVISVSEIRFQEIKKPSTRLMGRKEVFYLTTHSTHFIYGYMASDIW